MSAVHYLVTLTRVLHFLRVHLTCILKGYVMRTLLIQQAILNTCNVPETVLHCRAYKGKEQVLSVVKECAARRGNGEIHAKSQHVALK